MIPGANLDDPARINELRATIKGKPALRMLYEEVYRKYRDCVALAPGNGIVVELGSGGGFAKELVPGIVTSDVIPYEGVDRVVDATRMPFEDRSLRAIVMFNVFHHIPDAEAFLRDAERCLVPGGRMLIVDEHPGWVGGPVYRYAHHEGYDPNIAEWRFPAGGPLSSANGAMTWIVFKRDAEKFGRLFPGLSLVRYSPHTPLRYWLSGGLKRWTLLPSWAFGAATTMDCCLVGLHDNFGSFVDVELVRERAEPA